jgi:hypothetical protein
MGKIYIATCRKLITSKWSLDLLIIPFLRVTTTTQKCKCTQDLKYKIYMIYIILKKHYQTSCKFATSKVPYKTTSVISCLNFWSSYICIMVFKHKPYIFWHSIMWTIESSWYYIQGRGSCLPYQTPPIPPPPPLPNKNQKKHIQI